MHVSIELGKQRRKNSIKTASFALFFLLGVNSPASPRAPRRRSPRENVLRSRVGPRPRKRRGNSILDDSSRLTLAVAAPRSIYEDYRPLIAARTPWYGGVNGRGPILRAIVVLTLVLQRMSSFWRRTEGGKKILFESISLALLHCNWLLYFYQCTCESVY